MKHYTILLAVVVALSGCDVMQKEKVKSYKQWHQARARIICGVGEEHFKAGSLDKAQSCVVESLNLNSDFLPARILLAKILLGKGCHEEAAEQLEHAETLLTSSKTGEVVAAPMGAEVAYLHGEAMERAGRYDEALQHYQKARALDPFNDAYVMASAEVLVSMGKPKGALELLQVRLQRIGAGGEPSMIILAGEVAMLAGNYAEAADFFQRYLDMKQDPDLEKSNRSIRESLAKAQFFAGNYRLALESLKRITGNSDSRSCWVHIMTGDSYMALNRPRKAKAAYEAAVEIEPGDWPVWLSLAKAAVADGDGRRGIAAGLRALELADGYSAGDGSDKGRLEIAVVTAYAMLMKDRPADAMKVLAASAPKNPNDPMLWCMLGRCYSAQGRSDRASACYMAALRADPANRLAKNLLTGIAGRPEDR